MTISGNEIATPHVASVNVTNDTLSVRLTNGRNVTVPLASYPRLQHGSSSERQNWRLIGNGTGIHWEELDEDISIQGLIAGEPSGESPASFKRWLENRQNRHGQESTAD